MEKRDLIIDNSKNPNLNKVYTDSLGNNWYANRNPLKISGHRGISAEKAKRFLHMKIDEKNLKLLMEQQVAKFNAGDFVGAAAISHEISYRLSFICEERSMLDLALIYYFLEDEDPEVPHDYFREKKQAILETDPVARGFFLRIAVGLTKKFFSIPEEDLLKYLEKIKLESERIYRFISRQNPRDLINKSNPSSSTPVKEGSQT